jgi:ATP-dependent helicase HrpB
VSTPGAIDALLDELCETVTQHPVTVVAAPPGSGKTTRVPLALMRALHPQRRILMLEPRRVATRAAATYMAHLLDSQIGREVGYSVRFDRRVSRDTRVEVVTEGILTRRLQSDPELTGTGVVIFDEFHERNLHTDLGLALSLDVQQALRPDLRIVIMSATLDREAIARVLPDAPVLHAAGSPHPVDVRHRASGTDWLHDTIRALLALLREETGDALVFLPGVGEIRRMRERLTALPEAQVWNVCTLHGELDAAAQDRALRPDPDGRRRVVLATNIAESSLTLDGIRLVVDSGLARRPRFDPNTGLSRLRLHTISRASADQRAGRAGRQQPGVCLRLWSEHAHRARPAQDPPAITDSDLAGMLLELAAWGVADPAALTFLDPPPAGSTSQARDLLCDLGAVDAEGHITRLGRAINALPVHPRLGAMIAAAGSPPRKALACDLAALLEAPEILSRELLRDGLAGADLTLRLPPLHQRDVPEFMRAALRRGALFQARRSARALRRLCALDPDQAAAQPEDAGRLLLAAYPDRVARRRGGAGGQYLLRGGRGAALAEHDPLAREDYLVVADMDAGDTRARIHRAVGVAEADLRERLGAAIVDEQTVCWDPGQQRVVATQQQRLGALVLASRDQPDADPQRVLDALLQGIADAGLGMLHWSEETRQLRARLQCLREWYPEEPWMRMDDGHLLESLADWLGPWLHGVRRSDQLRRVDLAGALLASVPPPLRAHVDHRAPTHLQVPSGSRIRLHYEPGKPPVLAVKLQEMFGQRETPRICEGRVAVMVHLLSPARRPVQITQDLTGFWTSGYVEVRKELRGRYPKHPWPEDPTSAAPTRHTRSRR